MSTLFGVNIDNLAAFDAAYIASKPPAIQALFGMNPQSNRPAEAYSLATQGYILDYWIDAIGADPYLAMVQRTVVDQFVWVPSSLQAQPGNPYTMQSGPVPPGAIKVSTNIADYPPFNPAPPVPPAAVSPIGSDLGFQIGGKEAFSAQAGDPYPANAVYTGTAGTFVKTPVGTELMSAEQIVYVWLKQ